MGHRPWPKASLARAPHFAGNPMTFMDTPDATAVGHPQQGGVKNLQQWLIVGRLKNVCFESLIESSKGRGLFEGI